MKTTIVAACLQTILCLPTAAYKPLPEMSSIKFHVRSFGIRTDGSFKSITGTINFDGDHPQDAHFDMSVDAASVNTDNDLRDSHLRDESFFDVKRFPQITFVSKTITAKKRPGELTLTGDLTIKGHTQTISFPFRYVADHEKLMLTGSFNINRTDFNVGESAVIANDVTIDLNIIAIQHDEKIH
jgi:polyisoprenoid-binding protein YceI